MMSDPAFRDPTDQDRVAKCREILGQRRKKSDGLP